MICKTKKQYKDGKD